MIACGISFIMGFACCFLLVVWTIKSEMGSDFNQIERKKWRAK